MFENLSNRFEEIFKSLKKTGSIDEASLDSAMRDIRRALLEADVALPIAKKFIEDVKKESIGKEIIRSITPAQMITKIVNDQLIQILGSASPEFQINDNQVSSYLFAGLQGSGKTTTVGKIGNYLKSNYDKKILFVSLDTTRPAAFDQLKKLSELIDVTILPKLENQMPIDIVSRAKQFAELQEIDCVLYDTAGRMNVEEGLMSELSLLEKEINPLETILVLDSLTGQEAVNVASDFAKAINITGSILTRIDGDARGGAALSMKYITDCPIKFMGVGEQVDDLEKFHPERIANRILGMGDIVTLVEKAAETVDQEDAEEMAKKLQKGEFDLDDLLSQIRQMKKMGGISGMMKFIPGLSNLSDKIPQNTNPDNSIAQQEAIILSMTKYERSKPKIINGSRKKRIAAGSGTSVSEINKILKQHRKMSDMMKKLSRKGGGSIDPNMLAGQLGSGMPSDFFKNKF
ncbi:MAG: signal recognition particle protein [Candidatus Pelagibacterales bacterium]|nr:MAG: signal recognition particle protein [Pelagibacterales bacterium]